MTKESMSAIRLWIIREDGDKLNISPHHYHKTLNRMENEYKVLLVIIFILVLAAMVCLRLALISAKKYKDQLWYKDKCRVCGKVEQWHFGMIATTDYRIFLESVMDKTYYPRGYECRSCGEESVHDIISYSPRPDHTSLPQDKTGRG